MTRPLPDQAIKDAAKHGELVVFVGAGASMLCGSPGWSEFANGVVDELRTAGKLTFLEAEQLRKLGDPRRTLSIARSMAEEAGVHIDFGRILHPGPQRQAGAELYRVLARLRPVFVTTNYDRWLDDDGLPETSAEQPPDIESNAPAPSAERKPYYRREQLTPSLLAERGSVIHLHGSYLDPSSMVISLRDYIEHYADERVQAFLAEMFRSYTVLFVGYGLAELEVLDHIVRSQAAGKYPKLEARHYVLYPCRSTEHVQTGFIKRFYRDQCGVQVLPYHIDENGFEELLAVLRFWEPDLDVRDPTRIDLEMRLDRYVEQGDVPSRESAFRLIRNRPEVSTYFINALKDISWLDGLVSEGLLDARLSPAIKRVKGETQDLFQADAWPALRYLERVAATADDAHGRVIIELVRCISHDACQRGLENWRTWWSLATVLAQLPLGVITPQDIQMVEAWITGKFDGDMVALELSGKLLPRLLESPDEAHWEMAESLVSVLTMPRQLREGDE